MKNNDSTQAVKARIRLSDLASRYVELRQVGSRIVAPCPFHQETKPSFSINDDQGTFYCFGCHASGDIFDFYGRINGLDFKESLAALAEEAGVPLQNVRPDPHAKEERSKKRDMLKMHELAAAHFRSNLSLPEVEPCRAYLAERSISPEIQERFGLGWSLEGWQDLGTALRRTGFNMQSAVECGLLSVGRSGRPYDRFRSRLMFPIRSLSGQVVAFGGRVLPALAKEDDAKYINSSDSPIYKKGEHLFGLFQARPSISVQKCILLTEGYMDVVTLHQHGYTQAVGVLGTALTPDQIRRLSGFSSRLELMFDGDPPGRSAAFKACGLMLPHGLSCKVVLFPDNNDVDSMLRLYGKDALEELRAHAQDGLSFCISVLREQSPMEAVTWARNFLSQVSVPELFSAFAVRLASGLGISEKELRKSGSTLRGAPQRVRPDSVPPKKAATIDREVISFLVRYPHRLEDLRAVGADLLLSEPWAFRMWNKISRFCSEEAFESLDSDEKDFWIKNRGADAPPLQSEAVEYEAIRKMIEHLQMSAHKGSLADVLRNGTADQNTQRECLRALSEARGRHGDHQF